MFQIKGIMAILNAGFRACKCPTLTCVTAAWHWCGWCCRWQAPAAAPGQIYPPSSRESSAAGAYRGSQRPAAWLCCCHRGPVAAQSFRTISATIWCRWARLPKYMSISVKECFWSRSWFFCNTSQGSNAH